MYTEVKITFLKMKAAKYVVIGKQEGVKYWEFSGSRSVNRQHEWKGKD